jgi:adenine-specific DNA methylase
MSRPDQIVQADSAKRPVSQRPIPRLLIEEWLPAAAIGVECMRERGSASALAPHTYFHVWWARRPLTASRAAVLGSLLPADFPREVFERLLGFGHSSADLNTTKNES